MLRSAARLPVSMGLAACSTSGSTFAYGSEADWDGSDTGGWALEPMLPGGDLPASDPSGSSAATAAVSVCRASCKSCPDCTSVCTACKLWSPSCCGVQGSIPNPTCAASTPRRRCRACRGASSAAEADRRALAAVAELPAWVLRPAPSPAAAVSPAATSRLPDTIDAVDASAVAGSPAGQPQILGCCCWCSPEDLSRRPARPQSGPAAPPGPA